MEENTKDIKYDAFVSYKHGKIDSAAAEAVQKNLEHFRVPKSLKDCKQKIERVFVDEGELSSSSYFSRVIKDALKNAEWLIVICSRETKHSEWVNLEIKTFLEFHDRSRILAVITEGEPKDVYPEELLGKMGYEDEVLAADARGGTEKEVLKKLKKDALLKLAAPILGTSFDSLKQRRKTYIMQRAATAALILLVIVSGFSIYAVRQARLITEQAVRLNEEYENSFINQAKYMTQIAQNELENDNHAVAVETVLQVLPINGENQPVFAESIHVIAEALNLYRTKDSMRDTMTPTGTFRMEEVSKDMEAEYLIDESGKYLFSADTENVYVWDTETCSVKNKIASEGWIRHFKEGILVPEKSRILVPADIEIRCYDYEKDEVVWIKKTEEATKRCIVSGSGKITAVITESKISILNTETGEVIRTEAFDEKFGDTIAISKDDRWMAVIIDRSTQEQLMDNITEYKVLLFDIQNGTYEILPEKYESIRKLKFADEKRLFVVSGRGVTAIFREAHRTNTTYEKLYDEIALYDLEQKEFVWKKEMNYADTSVEIGLGILDNKVIYVHSDRALVLESNSGELIEEYEFDSTAVAIYGGENGFAVITMNGEWYFFTFGEEQWGSSKLFVDSIQKVKRNGTNYYIQRMDEPGTVIKYEYEISDSNFEELYANRRSGDGWIELAENGYVVYWENEKLIIVDGHNEKETEISLGDRYDYSILGFSDNYQKIIVLNEKNEGQRVLLSIDVETGDLKEKKVNAGDSYFMLEESARLFDQKMYYIVENDNVKVYCMDTETGEETLCGECDLDKEELYESVEYNSLSVNKYQDYAIFFTSAYVDNEKYNQQRWMVIMDLNKGTITKKDVTEYGLNPDEFLIDEEKSIVWCNTSNRVALRDEQKIVVIDIKGNKISEIELGEQEVESFAFATDDRYLLTMDNMNDNIICEYDIESGEELHRIETESMTSASSITWERINDSEMVLYTKTDNQKSLVLDTDPKTFGIVYYVENCSNYNANEACFYIVRDDWLGDDTLQIGRFKRYTTEKIIEKGQEFVGQMMQ